MSHYISNLVRLHFAPRCKRCYGIFHAFASFTLSTRSNLVDFGVLSIHLLTLHNIFLVSAWNGCVETTRSLPGSWSSIKNKDTRTCTQVEEAALLQVRITCLRVAGPQSHNRQVLTYLKFLESHPERPCNYFIDFEYRWMQKKPRKILLNKWDAFEKKRSRQ